MLRQAAATSSHLLSVCLLGHQVVTDIFWVTFSECLPGWWHYASPCSFLVFSVKSEFSRAEQPLLVLWSLLVVSIKVC